MPIVAPSRASTIALDFTYLHDRPRELQIAELVRRRLALRDDLRGRDVHPAVVGALHEQAALDRLQLEAGFARRDDAVGQPVSSTRMPCFFASAARAALPTSGAMMTSANCWPTMASADD